MLPQTELLTVARIAEIEIGLGECAVVQVELGEAKGYLIAERYTVRECPSEIVLNRAIYICVHSDEVEVENLSEIQFGKLLEHLANRFEPTEFTTSRRILLDESLPFSKASILRPENVHRIGDSSHGADAGPAGV